MERLNNKIVIFDWGGVIESHRDGEHNLYTAIINLIKHFNKGVKEEEIIERYYMISRISRRHKYPKNINDIEKIKLWFNRIKEEFSLECEFEEFCKFYVEEFDRIEYYKDVVELAHNTRKYCNTGILSNLGKIDKTRIDKQVELKKFDYVWLSCDLGCRKPEERIYEIVESECKIEAKKILFIDDSKENLDVALKRGWNVCQAFGYEINKIKESINVFLSIDKLY